MDLSKNIDFIKIVLNKLNKEGFYVSCDWLTFCIQYLCSNGVQLTYQTTSDVEHTTNKIINRILSSNLIDCCYTAMGNGIRNSNDSAIGSMFVSSPHRDWHAKMHALQCTVIEGPLILQVNEVINVNVGNKPADSTNRNDPNASNPKNLNSTQDMNYGNRLLKLSCTDGVRDYVCMELEYCPQLVIGSTENMDKNARRPLLYPGGKILLRHFPVHYGMILLSRGNHTSNNTNDKQGVHEMNEKTVIVVLGGWVDELVGYAEQKQSTGATASGNARDSEVRNKEERQMRQNGVCTNPVVDLHSHEKQATDRNLNPQFKAQFNTNTGIHPCASHPNVFQESNQSNQTVGNGHANNTVMSLEYNHTNALTTAPRTTPAAPPEPLQVPISVDMTSDLELDLYDMGPDEPDMMDEVMIVGGEEVDVVSSCHRNSKVAELAPGVDKTSQEPHSVVVSNLDGPHPPLLEGVSSVDMGVGIEDDEEEIQEVPIASISNAMNSSTAPIQYNSMQVEASVLPNDVRHTESNANAGDVYVPLVDNRMEKYLQYTSTLLLNSVGMHPNRVCSLLELQNLYDTHLSHSSSPCPTVGCIHGLAGAMKRFKIIPRRKCPKPTTGTNTSDDGAVGDVPMKKYEYVVYIGFEQYTVINGASIPSRQTFVLQIDDQVVERHLKLSADEYQHRSDHPPVDCINKADIKAYRSKLKTNACYCFLDFAGLFEVHHNPQHLDMQANSVGNLNTTSNPNISTNTSGIPLMLVTDRLDVSAVSDTSVRTQSSQVVEKLCASLLIKYNKRMVDSYNACSLAY